jgi:hypothetical protein
MRLSRLVVLALVIAVGAASVAAQTGTAVTVETREGDSVDGRLVSATETEVTIRVAGQPITLPLSEVRYLSFVGAIDQTDGSGDRSDDRPADGPEPLVAGLLNALRSIEAPANVGFDAEVYAEAFVRQFEQAPATGWADVRGALDFALRRYREPLESDYRWTARDQSFDGAVPYLRYAVELSSEPSEASHLEDAEETRVLALNQLVEGRLGWGDREMAGVLDSSSEGAYNDLFQFTLTEAMRTEIELRCTPCAPHLTVTDAAGAKIEGDAGSRGGRSRIRRDLEAGTYYIWAGTTKAYDGREYTLRVGPRR